MLDLSYLFDDSGNGPSLILNDRVVRKLEDAFLFLKKRRAYTLILMVKLVSIQSIKKF